MRLLAIAVLGVMGFAFAPDAQAGIHLEPFRGHLAVGYGQLFIAHAPGGSMSMAGGIDYPITSTIRFGVDIDYHLLGSRTVERGSLLADVDYSMFDAIALVHWTPPWPGPVGRISAGAGVFSAAATLATSGGGAGFSDLAVEETVPGFSLSATLISRKPSTLRLGLELGGRLALVENEPWSAAQARIAVHY